MQNTVHSRTVSRGLSIHSEWNPPHRSWKCRRIPRIFGLPEANVSYAHQIAVMMVHRRKNHFSLSFVETRTYKSGPASLSFVPHSFFLYVPYPVPRSNSAVIPRCSSRNVGQKLQIYNRWNNWYSPIYSLRLFRTIVFALLGLLHHLIDACCRIFLRIFQTFCSFATIKRDYHKKDLDVTTW